MNYLAEKYSGNSYRKLIFSICSLLVLSSCSDIDYSAIPGYKMLFDRDKKMTVVKRRPIENLITAGSPPIEKPFSLYKKPGDPINDYHEKMSFGQITNPPDIKQDRDPYKKEVGDFRSQFEPTNPIGAEESSLYTGRFMSQKGTGVPIPHGKTASSIEEEINKQQEERLRNPNPTILPPFPAGITNQVPSGSQTGIAVSPEQAFTSSKPKNIQVPQVVLPQQSISPGEPENEDKRRPPLLNQQVKMQLLSEISETNSSYPSLSAVPEKPDYNIIRSSMEKSIDELVRERNSVARHKEMSKDPVVPVIPPQIDPSILPPISQEKVYNNSDNDSGVAKLPVVESDESADNNTNTTNLPSVKSEEPDVKETPATNKPVSEKPSVAVETPQVTSESLPEISPIVKTEDLKIDNKKDLEDEHNYTLPNKLGKTEEDVSSRTEKNKSESFEIARQAELEESPKSLSSDYPAATLENKTTENPPLKAEDYLDKEISEDDNLPKSLLPTYPKNTAASEALEKSTTNVDVVMPIPQPIIKEENKQPQPEEKNYELPLPITIVSKEQASESLPVEEVKTVGIADVPEKKKEEEFDANKLRYIAPKQEVKVLPRSRYSNRRETNNTPAAEQNIFIYRQ